MIKILGIPLVEKLLVCLVDICGPHNLSNSNVTQMDIMAVSLYFIFGFLLHSRQTQGWEAEETWRQPVLVDKLVFLLLSRAARLWEKTISVCSNQTSWLTARHSCYQSCADVDHGPVGWSLPVSTRDSHGQRVRGRRTGCRVHSFIHSFFIWCLRFEVVISRMNCQLDRHWPAESFHTRPHYAEDCSDSASRGSQVSACTRPRRSK